LVKKFRVTLEVETCPPDVERKNLLSECQVPVVKGCDEHVVLVVENSTVSIPHQLCVGPAVGLGGVPQPGDQ
jgi:hypothetical protein